MSQRATSSFKYPSNAFRQTPKEVDKLFSQDAGLVNPKDLSSIEMEIISKINTIVTYLKDLEHNFSKARQDLLKKSTIEGRENSKICAVQGRIISNKTKYYKSLEDDMTSLSKAFYDQFKKISKEFDLIHNLSKGKADINNGSSGETFGSASVGPTTSIAMELSHQLPRKNHSPKCLDLMTSKSLQPNFMKTSGTLKEKTLIPFTLKADPLLDDGSRRISLDKSQIIPARSVKLGGQAGTPPKVIIRTMQLPADENNILRISPRQGIAVPKIASVIPIDSSSLDMETEKESATIKRSNNGVGTLELSREECDEGVLNSKPKSMNSFFFDFEKETSFENNTNFIIC